MRPILPRILTAARALRGPTGNAVLIGVVVSAALVIMAWFERSVQGVITAMTPFIIGFLPIILHIIDKGMERFSPIGEELIREEMCTDKRAIVSSVGQNHMQFTAIKGYFEFGRKAEFIVTLCLFNILSLYVAQTECTHNFLNATWVSLSEIGMIVIFTVVFLLKLGNRTFDLSDIDTGDNWVRFSLCLFTAVIITEGVLHVDAGLLGIACNAGNDHG